MAKYVVFDLDGVLTDAPSSWSWVHGHFGVDNNDSLNEFMEGRIDDLEFMRRDIALWQGQRKLHISEIEKILSTLPLMPGARETLSTLKGKGVVPSIISGGIEVHARKVGAELGIGHVMANPLETDGDGYLTGRGILKVPLKDKGSVLVEFQRRMGIGADDCVSVGNSQIDVPLFEHSRLGIAFSPLDDIVREHADVVIEKKDLREILPHVLG